MDTARSARPPQSLRPTICSPGWSMAATKPGCLLLTAGYDEVAPFYGRYACPQGALGEVDPFGATSLHDAIAAAAERVVDAADGAPRGRRAHRRHRYGEPADAGARSRVSPAAIDVPVYIIAVVLPIDDPGARRARPGAKRHAPRRLARSKTSRRGRAARCITAARRSARAGGPAGDRRAAPPVFDRVRAGRGAGWHPIEIRTYAEGPRGSDARRLRRRQRVE